MASTPGQPGMSWPGISVLQQERLAGINILAA
jgi:hypothetical protein